MDKTKASVINAGATRTGAILVKTISDRSFIVVVSSLHVIQQCFTEQCLPSRCLRCWHCVCVCVPGCQSDASLSIPRRFSNLNITASLAIQFLCNYCWCSWIGGRVLVLPLIRIISRCVSFLYYLSRLVLFLCISLSVSLASFSSVLYCYYCYQY